MNLLNIVAVGALLNFALAAPAPASEVVQAAIPSDYWFNVTRWGAGCSDFACSYAFNVAAPLKGIRPHFKAYCSGRDTGNFKQCTIIEAATTSGPPEVYAKLKPEVDSSEPDGRATISVQLAFTDADDGFRYAYTGNHIATYNRGTADGRKFKVIPTKATVVG